MDTESKDHPYRQARYDELQKAFFEAHAAFQEYRVFTADSHRTIEDVVVYEGRYYHPSVVTDLSVPFTPIGGGGVLRISIVTSMVQHPKHFSWPKLHKWQTGMSIGNGTYLDRPTAVYEGRLVWGTKCLGSELFSGLFVEPDAIDPPYNSPTLDEKQINRIEWAKAEPLKLRITEE